MGRGLANAALLFLVACKAVNPGDDPNALGKGDGGMDGMVGSQPDMAQQPDLTPPPDLLPKPDLGGRLDGTVADASGVVDLTSVGTLDWAHWGLWSEKSVTRKAGITSLITDLTTIGTTTQLHQYTDNHVIFSWSDGAPTATHSGSSTGVFILGEGNGLSIDAPADGTVRTLRIWLSGFGCDFQVGAHLSDGSDWDYNDTVINPNPMNVGIYKVYTFVYKSLNPGQTLKVRWTDVKDHFGGGNVTLQAATLQ
jgi:hypothetical protein